VESLLSHLLFTKKGSGEDLATESLKYFLDRSSLTRARFVSHCSAVAGVPLDSELRFVTQASGKERERPDLVGIGRDNGEVLIVESKFWAGLTGNQPAEYLKTMPIACFARAKGYIRTQKRQWAGG